MFLPAAGSAQGWNFLGDANLFLGQYFFKKSAGSLEGYGDVSAQAARSFSPESGFYVTGRSVYTGFKQVNELAGGGTLFQQSWDNSLGFKWIRRFEGGYSLKPRVGVRSQLFRETNNEKWGKGLYDFGRYEAGVTWERKTRWSLSVPWTYQFSYDFYYTHYPHFKSLASQFGSALGSPDPGANVLDTFTNQLTYRSEFDLPGFATLWGLYSLSLVQFTDSKVVNSQGQYLNSGRTDAFHTLTLGYSKRLNDWQPLGRVRPIWGAALAFSNLNSNQNNFDTDPNRLKYVGGYYNYWETHVSPSVGGTFLALGLNVRLGYDFAYRGYTGRLTQNEDGSYNNGKLNQYTHSVSLDAAYPLWRGLDFKVRGMYSSSNSNTRYEQTYVYSYNSYNYFAGIQWRL